MQPGQCSRTAGHTKKKKKNAVRYVDSGLIVLPDVVRAKACTQAVSLRALLVSTPECATNS